MSQPVVCCIMLTKDRPQMAVRAVRCFREQTYGAASRFLLIWDTGDPSWYDPRSDSENEHHWTPQGAAAATIGSLRNTANMSAGRCDVFAHWDSDDFSHPNRLAEQVALLQASGAEAVGYNSMLFWDTRKYVAARERHLHDVKIGDGLYDYGSAVEGLVNEAWLYRAINPQHILGTSLLYWRSTWERQPFDDVPTGEDTRWVAKLGKKAVGVSSLNQPLSFMWENGVFKSVVSEPAMEPRMIASVHGGNSSGYEPEKDRASTKRAPEWDSYCRKVMQL